MESCGEWQKRPPSVQLVKTVQLAAWLGVLLSVLSFAAPPGTLDGKWVMQGDGGWQRIEFNFATSGSTVKGTITMGPGPTASRRPADDWEYFFEPATFAILNGKLDGSALTFEQSVMRAAGRAPNEILRYTGKIDGDTITFVRESHEIARDAFVLGNHRIGFVATRATVAAPLSVSSHLQERTAPSRNRSSNAADMPTNLLLMFDHNDTWLVSPDGSDPFKYGASQANEVLNAAGRFVEKLRPTDRVALADFEQMVQSVVEWRDVRGWRQRVSLDLTRPPTAQKDLYGAVRWALQQLGNLQGRKIAVIYSDGRDGRLSPRWLRSKDTVTTTTQASSSERIATRPVGPATINPSIQLPQEVLDPLFGLHDDGEASEFEQVVAAVANADIEFYFVAIQTTREPEFGPALVGRRISGLFPGSNEAIDRYISESRRRLEVLAEASGGKVFYGETAKDAAGIYESLPDTLGIGQKVVVKP